MLAVNVNELFMKFMGNSWLEFIFEMVVNVLKKKYYAEQLTAQNIVD